MTNYDPWGTPQGTLGTPFGFAGELQQGGNVYLRARWYNSGNGTFTARDSFAGYPDQPASLALYQYTNNLPTVHTDPSGHCPGCPVQPDPRKWDWQGGCDYLKAIAGADRDARYCGIEHASDELSVYGFNPSPGWYRNHIHDGEHWIEAGQQAADWIHDGLAEGKDLRGFAGDVGDALGKAIKRPWQEFADGWRCHDSYLVGRGARGIGEQAINAATFGETALGKLSGLVKAGEVSETTLLADDAVRSIAGARRSPLVELSPSEIAEIQQEFREIGGDVSMLRFKSLFRNSTTRQSLEHEMDRGEIDPGLAAFWD